MIVVTGSTGHVGALVARELARRGAPMRLLVRDPARAPAVPGAEAAVGAYDDADALDRALHPGDRVFMVSLHEGPDRRVPLHRAFVEAATRRRVGHIVYLSFLHAGPHARFLHARSHGATEAMLRASGVPFTSVRNGMYADDLMGWFDPDGVLREPGGDGRMSFSYRPELAEAIAAILTEDGHQGKVYDVTARDAVTLAELARIVTEVTGRPHRYAPEPDEAWVERWRQDGGVGWQIEAGVTSYEALRAGELAVEASDFGRLVGREPATVRELILRLITPSA